MLKRTVQLVSVLTFGWLAQACATDNGESETRASGESQGMCSAGQEGCPCAQGGACAVGLTCISNACVDAGMVSVSASDASTGSSEGETSSTSGTTGGGSGSSTSGDPACDNNAECGFDEVCYNSLCTWVGALYFEVTVHDFTPPDCSDGWGEAELYYDFIEDGVYVSSSAISTCPASWSSESVWYDPLKSFLLQFWESDAFDDDLITSLCWGGDSCGPVPYEILREGWWSGLDGEGIYYLALSFDPVYR
jgi:hypothetical protein